ncbi:FKBP-type peptidyl-prolyl cis-trans isomerase [Lapillicoccus sp.]|uniref:FKBP-type peptidyl-prolyl cis-trans isomerase n=1 Tax=Lapillicoccus sp. TaxID=1909287 RepID=UPI003264B708
MRSFRPAVAAAVLSVLCLTTVAACSSGSPGSSATTTPAGAGDAARTNPAHPPVNNPADVKILEGITVAGDDPAVTPKVTFGTLPVSVGATASRTLKDGTGAASKAGDKVTVRQALFLGSTGKQLQSDFESKETPAFTLGGQDSISGLVTALTGVKAGSRVLFAIPPAEAFGDQGRTAAGIGGADDLVVVADIVSISTPLTQATGTVVAPVAGAPTVAFDATTGPTITVPKTAAPTTLVVQNLIDGAGAQVKSGQNLTVHYTGVVWADGTVFDSSWARKSPASFQIGTGNVIPGWDKGLVGKKVGSRVLMVIPPADGYGAQAQGKIPANSTLVFVVDILDAS